MSGGSGCQQIKLFVLRPGFGTLSLLSSFLPLSPCVSFFSSLFLFSQYFFSLQYTIVQSPALPLLDCISLSFPLPPAPPFFSHFLRACARRCLMRLVFADEACACLYMCTSQHDDTRLCWWSQWERVCVHALICMCLLCTVQHDETGLCWWSFSLKSLQTFPHYQRKDKCTALEGGRPQEGREPERGRRVY